MFHPLKHRFGRSGTPLFPILALLLLTPDAAVYCQDLFQPGSVTTDLTSPTAITHAGDGSGRLFVTERGGWIRIVQNGALLATPFLNLASRVRSDSAERGLLGLAFHPDYASNGQFFVNYTDLDGDTVVARFTRGATANQGDPDSQEILLTIAQTAGNHNGGDLSFGPDGYLYIAVGDGGAKETREVSLMPERLLGKLLRIDPDGGVPYGIPGDNPYSQNPRAVDGSCGAFACPEIFSLGLRNPWRIGFDRHNGDLFVADVGQWVREEVNHIDGFGSGGQNFGWPCREGLIEFAGDNFPPPSPASCQGSYTDPVFDYSHSQGRCSITGGTVYRKPGEHYAKYFYGDYCTGEIFSAVQQSGGAWQVASEGNLGERLTTFGVDEAGHLYAAGAGGVLRKVANPDGIFADTFEIRSTTNWSGVVGAK